MNQGRIWCVVNPTVGLPLFLGSVTLIALVVHYHVLTKAPVLRSLLGWRKLRLTS
jgi:light-harvesting protein B-800-850 alpha chain